MAVVQREFYLRLYTNQKPQRELPLRFRPSASRRKTSVYLSARRGVLGSLVQYTCGFQNRLLYRVSPATFSSRSARGEEPTSPSRGSQKYSPNPSLRSIWNRTT